MPVARRGRPALTPPTLRGFVLLAAVAVLGACDTEPGLPTEAARPTIESVRVTPLRDSLATAAPTATVPRVVEAVVGGEGPVTVRVFVRYQETDSLAGQATAEVAPGPVRVEVPLTLPRGATGAYAVTVSTAGPDGQPGDRAAAVFRFAAASLGPPTVTVNEPAPVARPTGTDTAEIPIRATVTDPDGLANVAAVLVRDPETGATIGRLFDDGEGSDDAAGDGVYSAAVVIGADFQPGTISLEVVALDRAETFSEPATFTFTVQ